jgi:small-conductance mechanosensitive channel
MTSQTPPAPLNIPMPKEAMAEIGPRLDHYGQVVIAWVQGNWFELMIAASIAVAIFAFLSWLKHLAAKTALNTEHRSDITSIIARTLARTSKFFRIMVALELVNGYAGAPHPVARTIEVLFTIAVVIQVAIWLREIILGLIERRAGADGSEHETLASAMVLIRLLVSFALFAIAAIVILDNLGINVTGLVAGLGVGGIAIGLAAQGIFSDLFAAISIIFDKPFKRGDTISYDTTIAHVEKIGMKSTRLRALSGEEKIISNSKLLEMEITNLSALTFRRTTFIISLVYHTAPQKIAALPAQLQQVVEANGGIFVRSGFTGFGASSLDVQLVFDVETSDYNEVFVGRHAIGLAILELLAREDIEMAYPTQTTYTAAPDGTLVMPYAQPVAVPAARKRQT